MPETNDNLIEVNRLFNLHSTMYERMNREKRKTLPPPTTRPPAVSGPGPRIYRAYRYAAGQMVLDSISPWPGHEFVKYATPWELKRSTLTRLLAERFEPVVQEVLEGFALVVGHRGWVNTTRLIAPKGLPITYHPGTVLERGYPLFVMEDDPTGGRTLDSYVPPGWTIAGYSDQSAEVLTTVDGQVLAILDGRTRGPEAMDITPLDLILGARLLVGLGAAVGSKMVRVLARKESSQAARAFAGPTEDLATTTVRQAAAAGPSLNGIKLAHGYDRRMGIPRGHLQAMVEAAKETNSVAVFRANKQAAITLIENGAVGKPKALSIPGFKSKEATGVLTASAPEHFAVASKNGFFVVEADGVARRTILRNGKPVVEELKLKNPYWRVEKGQVIDPSGHPVVGDYDLLGVIPLGAPGRNIVAVPRDTVKGDWIGPDVARYNDAVNRRLDKPRVLHGAQDGFHNKEWGGFTDDVAYAVFPNGNTLVMTGKAEQKAFYEAFGRQTAVGSYPRPAPGTPVKDELAARRGR
jgi:hypothetical protein